MRGYTIIEILIAVAIVLILTTVVFQGITSFRESNDLARAADIVYDTLNKARALTLASKEQSVYGARLASSTITLFKGPSYVIDDPDNEIKEIPSLVVISGLSLASTSPDIVFKRLSGETDNYGTITLTTTRNPLKTKNIEIYNSGLSELR